MEDARIWDFERGLWTGGADLYRQRVDEACLMALPAPPYVFGAVAAIDAVEKSERWDSVEFANKQVSRPEQGLIVIAYLATATASDRSYRALCSSTLRRLGHDDWQLVQHQQTPLGNDGDAPPN